MKKLLSKIVSLVAVASLALAILPNVTAPTTAEAATKRTAVVNQLVSSTGKLDRADWKTQGDKDKFEVANNGKVFKVEGAEWPGVRIFSYDAIPAGVSYYVDIDVIKLGPAQINLSGFVTNWSNGASSNIYLTNTTISPAEGTHYGANGNGQSVWNGVNSLLREGYSHRFFFRISPEDSNYGDLIIYTKPIGVENATWTEECVLYKLCTLDTADHYAHLYFIGDITVDNFKVTTLGANNAETVHTSTDFSDASLFVEPTGATAPGYFYRNGGNIVTDSYFGLSGAAGVTAADRVVSFAKAEVDGSLDKVFELNSSVKVTSTAGKAGIALGLDDAEAAVDAAGVSYVYFENTETSTTVNVSVGGVAQTAVDLGKTLSDDFHPVQLVGYSNGNLDVVVDGAKAATFTGVDCSGYVSLTTDGNAGAAIYFLPAFTVNTFALDLGTGADLENNFNTGYINKENYSVDSYGATTLGANGKGIVAEDGILKFDGTSDGAGFGIEGIYADFILQFDWINYAWEDRPTKEDGTVYNVAKPENGYATELYSPLGVAFGLAGTGDGWASNKLLRIFDGYNLIQYMENGAAYNYPMGASIFSAADCANIQEGKIAFYENTINFKIVVRNGVLQVWGVVMVDGEADGEHVLLMQQAIENYTGYVAIKTTEAGYFGIDNLRITKIDQWTDEQMAAYENFKTIADEEKPAAVALTAPVVSVEGTTVSWTAVENAAGYKVTVNGVEGEATTETSYTLPAESEDGEYVITVKALGDSDLYTDSVASNEVTITVGEQESVSTPESTSEPTSTPESNTEATSTVESTVTGGSCFSGVSAIAILAVLAPMAVVMLKKKED